jgi:hypothetical protein
VSSVDIELTPVGLVAMLEPAADEQRVALT